MQIATDPVCGTELEEQEAEGALLYSDCEVRQVYFCSPCSKQQRWRFFFCSPECKAKFDLAPGFYGGLAAAQWPPARPEQLPE
jgi:YHS domain-containing protein